MCVCVGGGGWWCKDGFRYVISGGEGEVRLFSRAWDVLMLVLVVLVGGWRGGGGLHSLFWFSGPSSREDRIC